MELVLVLLLKSQAVLPGTSFPDLRDVPNVPNVPNVLNVPNNVPNIPEGALDVTIRNQNQN